MQAEIYNVDYNQFVHILGTAHFTRRSFFDAHYAVDQLKPTDLAIELDMERFQELNNMCTTCPENKRCSNKCEFIGAADALGNVDANIWLIDMTGHQFRQRARMFTSRTSVWRVLIDERDTLMAARLVWITTKSLRTEANPNILALVGAAHVKGIKSLLRNPMAIRENLRWLELSFTPPTLVRRVQITTD